jgi:hypothetical protein
MSESEKLFKQMLEVDKIEPDLYVWCSLLISYCNNCEINKLYKSLMIMENQNQYPTSAIFKKILESISNLPVELQKKAKKLKILVDKMSKVSKVQLNENFARKRFDQPKVHSESKEFDVTNWAEF